MRDVGLALSGGGSRAVAFHLGCLRALHDRRLLDRVGVLSGISGGSLLSALWAYGPRDFAQFEVGVIALLQEGLHGGIVRRWLNPRSLAQEAVATPRLISRGGRLLGPTSPLRTHTRTEALAAVVAASGIGDRLMSELTHPDVDVVLTATDLRTGGAVRFGSRVSGASRIGRIVDHVLVRDAVAASAAYPLLLPALERRYTFERKGVQRPEVVLLTDGGVYDNLGLSVLEPGRSAAFTDHVYAPRFLISCDAGRVSSPRAPRFLLGRTARAFEIVHRRAQDHGRARLHEWARAGAIDGFVLAYLAMDDRHLPVPLADLVPREAVASVGTDFAPMKGVTIELLAARGEQLVRTLLPHYCPALAR